MLQALRNLKPEAKKKVALICAGILTFFVFIFWVITFSGAFLNSLSDATTKGASAYGAFEQNIEKVYNTMTKMVPKDLFNVKNENTNIATDTPATTTDSMIN